MDSDTDSSSDGSNDLGIRVPAKKDHKRCSICGVNRISHPYRKFFSFPKDPVLSQQWVRACLGSRNLAGRTPEQLNVSYKVCSEHFTLWDYATVKQHRLIAKAVPKINLVPQCTSTSIKTPEKVFVHVPVKADTRKKWLALARRDASHLSPRSKMHFCEDHFDLEKDMANYMEYSMTKSVKRMKMREGCLPSKFECQERGKKTTSKLRSAEAKRRTIAKSQEYDRILEEYWNKDEKTRGSAVAQGNYDEDTKVSVFNFPKDEDLKNKWLRAIPSSDLNVTKNSRVCEDHFKVGDILYKTIFVSEKTGEVLTAPFKRPKLKGNAVPSIFLDSPSCSVSKPSTSRKLPRTSTSPESPQEKRLHLEQAQTMDSKNIKKRGEGWEEENMAEALQAVIDGVPVQRVSQEFSIPRRTLRNHILSGTATKKLGCPPALTALQESRLCKRLMDVGATFTPQVLMRSVVTFSNELKIPHRFQFGIASRKWIRGFLSRHPEILVRNENDTNPTKVNKKREIGPESSSSNERSSKKSASSSSREVTPPPAPKPEPPADVKSVVPDPPAVLPAVAETPGSSSSSTTTTTPIEYVIKAKRFVNVGFLIKSLQKLNDHGVGGCNFSDMAICGETKEGWNIGVLLSCRVCFTSAVVWMEDPEEKLVKQRPKVPQTGTVPQGKPFLQPTNFTERAPSKLHRPHRTPTPPPEPPTSVRFLVPLPLARSAFLPQAKEVTTKTKPQVEGPAFLPQTKEVTKTQPQGTNPPVANQPFIKQEVILPDDGASPSTSQALSSSTQPTSVQMLFYVDQPESSQASTVNSSMVTSSFESVAATPDVYVGSQTSSATSSRTLSASENITVTPDIYPAGVLPVDLNLVKQEIEDGPGHQDLSVCLVPMSETSLDPSRTLFASDVLESTTSTEISRASSGTAVSSVVNPTQSSETSRNTTRTSTTGTTASNVPGEYSMATSRSAFPKYCRLISKENTKSLIWKHFGLPADENGLVVDNSIKVCKICLKRVSSNGASTTNMISHLKLHHTSQYKDMLKAPKRCLPSRSRIYEISGPNRSRSNENVQCATFEDATHKNQTLFLNYRPKYSKLITKTKSKSMIWKYFGLPADENGLVVDSNIKVCKICMKRVASKEGNSSNMFGHLKQHHPLKYKDVLKRSKRCSYLSHSSNRNEIGDPECPSSTTNLQNTEDEHIKDANPPIIKTEVFSVNSQPLYTNALNSPKFSKLISKKKAKSVIWKHFGLPADESGVIVDNGVVVCKICMYRIYYKGGTTSNMFSHLKLHHPLKYKNMCKGFKSDLPSTNSSIGNEVYDPNLPIKNPECMKEELLEDAKFPVHKNKLSLNYRFLDSNSSENCIESITKFLAFTLQPYYLVEMKPFIDMIRHINPSYKIPSRKYFSNTGIPKLYNDSLEKLKLEMTTIKVEEISITMDCWTSVANTPYIAVTIHFIDHLWNLKSACIKSAYFDINHAHTNICNTLTGALSNWGLDLTNVIGCTSDNGSSISKAMSQLQLPHISCFGHNLSVGINRALGIYRLDKAVSKLKNLQSAISQNCKMILDLAKAQEILQVDVVYLSSTCPTRWWSTLKLIRRFLSNQLPICKMLDDYPDQKQLLPDASDVSAMEDFVSNTKLIKDIITTLSGDEYISASSVLPLYRKIKKNLQCQDSDSALSKLIKSEILSALSERYEEESLKTILWMSSLCDPRFRLNFTDNPDDIKSIALQKMICVYKIIDSLAENQSATSDIKKKGLEKLFEIEDNSFDNDSLPANKAQAELNKYLTMPKVNMNVNPLTWWKSHASSFPVLKTLAKKYLAIQGSSVPSERLFSTRGNVIIRQRAALLPKHVEMQVFLSENKSRI